MAHERSAITFGGLSLTTVLREIAERLRAADWERRTGPGATYYIVGFHAHVADVEGRIHFDSEFPAEKSHDDPKPLPPLALWQLRAEVAARQAKYLEQAKARLVEMGIDRERLELAQEKADASDVRLSDAQSEDDFVQALMDLVQAVAIAKGTAVPETDSPQFRALREKHYLERIVRKYETVVSRSSKLDTLDFEDAQLFEASECFLYGFHRAVVMLSAAAVEAQLRKRTGLQDREKTPALLDAAQRRGLLDGGLVACGREVFEIRNRVAHDQRSVDVVEAERVLDLARRVVSELVQRQA